MCRWLAYSGSPVQLDELLFEPRNSLVVQSRDSTLGAPARTGAAYPDTHQSGNRDRRD